MQTQIYGVSLTEKKQKELSDTWTAGHISHE